MYACLCRAVSERNVRTAVAGGADTVAQVRAACGAGTGCGGCLPSLRRLLREELASDDRVSDDTMMGVNQAEATTAA